MFNILDDRTLANEIVRKLETQHAGFDIQYPGIKYQFAGFE